nr:dTDP-4-dehydrorhamnose 3,5-epimerase [Eubacterium aggregans]
MMGIEVVKTKIDGLVIVKPQVFGDDRGYFMETYNQKVFEDAGLDMVFIQDNESKSKKGVLRGLHFQRKFSQGKLVRCTQGAVWDVGVDLRKGSKTYGQWEGVTLSADNKTMFYIPEGFAHGFVVLTDEATFNYKCTNLYAPEYDGGIRWNDPDVGVEWPIEGLGELLLSDKDQKQPFLKEIKDTLEF